MNPTGQIAIVTGAGSGLGEATARALAARGARVAAVDLDIGRAERVAGDIGGIARVAEVAAEQPGAGDARRGAADAGADAGIAGQASGEAVLFGVVGR